MLFIYQLPYIFILFLYLIIYIKSLLQYLDRNMSCGFSRKHHDRCWQDQARRQDRHKASGIQCHNRSEDRRRNA